MAAAVRDVPADAPGESAAASAPLRFPEPSDRRRRQGVPAEAGAPLDPSRGGEGRSARAAGDAGRDHFAAQRTCRLEGRVWPWDAQLL